MSQAVVHKFPVEECQNQSPRGVCKAGFIKTFAKFTGKQLSLSLCNLIKKETPTQVFSCKLCEIVKNSFLQNTFGNTCKRLRAMKNIWGQLFLQSQRIRYKYVIKVILNAFSITIPLILMLKI